MRTGAHGRPGLSPALVAAIGVAATVDPEPCAACAATENQGLCHSERCRENVLPVLAEPAWYKDAHSLHYREPDHHSRTRATEHAARMAAQSARRVSSFRRLGRALDDCATRTRHRRSA